MLADLLLIESQVPTSLYFISASFLYLGLRVIPSIYGLTRLTTSYLYSSDKG